jgi:uncharacterized protein
MSRKKRRNPKTWAQPHRHPEMTPTEQALCLPAAAVDQLAAPVPTRWVSNGEYLPPVLQTAKQAELEHRIREKAALGARKHGISRRKFLSSSLGMATCFIALNETFRKQAFGADLFKVGKEGMFDKDAYLADGPPSDLFVFDDQTHIVRGAGELGHIGTLLRVAAQGETARFPNSPFLSNPNNFGNAPDEFGNPWGNWNPRLINTTNWDASEYWLHNYIKYMYFESQTTVALVSNAASGTNSPVEGAPYQAGSHNPREGGVAEILTADQTHACKNFINTLAGSTRALAHGHMWMGPGNIQYLQEEIERHDPDSWKGYQNPTAKRDDDPNTAFETWTFDDQELAFPTFEFLRDDYRKNGARKPGRNCICVHKGLGGSSFPQDIPVAAAAFPELNFIIYHACMRPSFFAGPLLDDLKSGRLREGVPDLLDITEFAQLASPHGNIYAELGTTFATVATVFPTVAAHMMGILFKYFGAERIVWGTDSTWYGSPQWQIEAFWRLQIPEEMRRTFCYPEITPEMKRQVLGLNSARLYRMTPDLSQYKTLPVDYFDRMRCDAALMSLMEYDDRAHNDLGYTPGPLPNTPATMECQPVPNIGSAGGSPYGVATAKRGDRMELLRAHYREKVGAKFGVPQTPVRHGWIRVR